MQKNYFTLRALAAHFSRSLAGHRFLEAYSHQPGELMLSFLGEDGMKDLRVITGVKQGCVLMVPHANAPKRNVMRFFESLGGAIVASATIAISDRTIVMEFRDRGSLQIRLFGAGGGNVVQFDVSGKRVESFKKEDEPAQRSAAQFPTWEELIADEKVFAETLLALGTPLGASLNKCIPALGKPLVEEILLRCGLNPLERPADIGSSGMAKLFQVVNAVVDECCNAPQPRVYLDGAAVFALIPLRAYSAHSQLNCGDVNEGIRRWIAEHGKADGVQQERQRIAAMVKNFREHLESSIVHVRKDLESNKEEELQKTGETLLEHIAEIPAGAKEIMLDGQTITLDPKRNAGQNAAVYFDKAKQRKAAVQQAQRRLENLVVKLEEAKIREVEFESVHTRDTLEAFVLKYHDVLTKMEKENPNIPNEYPYRVYELGDDCTVFVGKNAKQNDELTFHFAKQNDLWFHVRGAEGSHTIMRWARRDAPPKEFILKAAAIAAFHSKAKTSRFVPVLYTQRKFVHKPRGAKPGSVVATREEVVMVSPGLPGNASE